MTKINEYEIEGELKNDNSGFSKWGYCNRDGSRYFIKEFLSPIYADEQSELSADTIEKIRRECYEYQRTRKTIYEKINKASDGNLVRIEEFFRCENHYYITTKMVSSLVKDDEINKLSVDEKITLCRILAHSISRLHTAGLVHGDLKWSNILFTRLPKGTITVKVIDFDECYWDGHPTENREALHGDFVYMAPETFLYIVEEEVNLTVQTDVFALGIIFYQIFTGEHPKFTVEEYDYPYEAVLLEGKLVNHPSLPPGFYNLIQRMLMVDPDERINVQNVFRRLSGESETLKVTEIKKKEPEVEDKTSERSLEEMKELFKRAGNYL